MKKHGYCANKSTVQQQSSRTKYTETWPSRHPKNQPDTSPNPLKSRLGALPGTKMCPRSIPDRPRDAQERPRSVQDAPKERPRGAKSCPRWPKSWPSDVQEAPNMAPDPSKIHSGEPQNEFVARSWWGALFERLLERCCVIFECAQKARDM